MAFFCAMVARFTVGTVLSITTKGESYGHISDNAIFTFGTFDSQNGVTYYLYEVPLFILMGAAGGILGALYNYLNRKLTMQRCKFVTTRRAKLIEVLCVCGLVSTIAYWTPVVFRECGISVCLPLPDNPVNSTNGLTNLVYVQYDCPEGQYNEPATLFFTSSEMATKHLYHSETVKIPTVMIYSVLFYLLSCLTYGIAVPSGLFVPNLLVGAAFGRITGECLKLLGWQVVDPGTYSLIGSAAMLGGMARMTISLTVILIEATADIKYAFPLMLTLMSAKIVGDLMNEGLYDLHIGLKKIPFLEDEPDYVTKFLLVSHIMSTEVVLITLITLITLVTLITLITLIGMRPGGVTSGRAVGLADAGRLDPHDVPGCGRD